MRQIFLTILVIYLLPIFQSAIISEIFPHFLKPDLMLILIIYLGIYNSLLPGTIKTLASGLFYDSLSGSPLGLFLVIYLAIFFLIKLLEKVLILGENKVMPISLLVCALIFQYLAIPAILFAMGIWKSFSLPKITWLWPQILTTCLFAWPLFGFFRKILTQPIKDFSSIP